MILRLDCTSSGCVGSDGRHCTHRAEVSARTGGGSVWEPCIPSGDRGSVGREMSRGVGCAKAWDATRAAEVPGRSCSPPNEHGARRLDRPPSGDLSRYPPRPRRGRCRHVPACTFPSLPIDSPGAVSSGAQPAVAVPTSMRPRDLDTGHWTRGDAMTTGASSVGLPRHGGGAQPGPWTTLRADGEHREHPRQDRGGSDAAPSIWRCIVAAPAPANWREPSRVVGGLRRLTRGVASLLLVAAMTTVAAALAAPSQALPILASPAVTAEGTPAAYVGAGGATFLLLPDGATRMLAPYPVGCGRRCKGGARSAGRHPCHGPSGGRRSRGHPGLGGRWQRAGGAGHPRAKMCRSGLSPGRRPPAGRLRRPEPAHPEH